MVKCSNRSPCLSLALLSSPWLFPSSFALTMNRILFDFSFRSHWRAKAVPSFELKYYYVLRNVTCKVTYVRPPYWNFHTGIITYTHTHTQTLVAERKSFVVGKWGRGIIVWIIRDWWIDREATALNLCAVLKREIDEHRLPRMVEDHFETRYARR